MALRRITGTGATNGAAVTANGTPGGNALTVLTVGGTATLVWSSTTGVPSGVAGKAIRMQCPATTDTVAAGLGAQTAAPLAGSAYIYITAWNAAILNLFQYRTTGQNGGISLDATHHLRITNAGGTALKTFTNALSLNTMYRIDVFEDPATTTTGVVQFGYYLEHDTSPVETLYSVSNVNVGTADPTEFRIAKSDTTGTCDLYIWGLADDNTAAGLIGPGPHDATVVGVSLPSATVTGLAGTVDAVRSPTVVAASLPSVTATGLAGSVSVTANPTVVGASLPSVAVTALAGTVSATRDATISGTLPSATVTGLAGAVDVTANPTVVAASLPMVAVTGLAGSVSADANTVGASVPTVTATALAGTVTGDATVAGVLSTATVTGLAGTVDATRTVSIDGALASVTATGLAGSVDVTANPTIAGPLVTATITAPAGTPVTSGSVAVSGPLITATANALAGVADVTANPTVDGAVASSTTTALPGDVTATSGVTVAGPTTRADVSAPAGTVEAIENVTIAGLVAQANAQALAGLVVLDASATVAGPVVLVTITAPPGGIGITTDPRDITITVELGDPTWTGVIAAPNWTASLSRPVWRGHIDPVEDPVYATDRAIYTPDVVITGNHDLSTTTFLMWINEDGDKVPPDLRANDGTTVRLNLLLGTDAYPVDAGVAKVWVGVADSTEDFDIFAGSIRVRP